MAKIRLRRGVATLAVAFVLTLFIAPRLLISNVESSVGTRSGAVDLAGPAQAGELEREATDVRVLDYEGAPAVYLMNASIFGSSFPISNPKILRDFDLNLRFKPDLAPDHRLRLGLRNASAEGDWRNVYDPFLQDLSEWYEPSSSAGTEQLIRLNPDAPMPSHTDLADFRPPPYVIVMSNHRTLAAQSPGPDELPPAFAFPANLPPPVRATPLEDVPIGLRWDESVLFWANASKLEYILGVRDDNGNAGPDTMDVAIKRLDGSPVTSWKVPDDGDVAKDKKASWRNLTAIAELEPQQWYAFETRNTAGDLTLDHLWLPGPRIFYKQLVLGGPTFGNHARFPVNVTIQSRGGNLALTLSSAGDNGTVRLFDPSGSPVPLSFTGTKSSVGLGAGTYRLQTTKGALVMQSGTALFSFAPGSITTPRARFAWSDSDGVHVRTPIRGNHVFWTYVEKSGPLRLTVQAQDLNLYNNADNLTLELSDLAGRTLATASFPDDGSTTNSSVRGPMVSRNLTLDEAAPGTYRLTMKGSADYVLRAIDVNQRRFVAASLFLLGYNPCCFASPPIDNQVDVYYASLLPGSLAASTYHASGIQTLLLDSMDRDSDLHNASLPLNKTTKAASVDVPRREELRIRSPVQDIILAGPGYFSFTRDSFFYPVRNPTVKYVQSLPTLVNATDYAYIDYGSYEPLDPPGNDGWYTWHHRWTAREANMTDYAIRFYVQVPGFDRAKDELRIAPPTVDTHLVPLYERNPIVEWGWRLIGRGKGP